MKMSTLKGRKKKLYHNCKILSPDGELMCRVSEKRAQKYLDKGLAEIVEDETLTIQLNFKPKGRGHADSPGAEVLLAEIEEKCVSCGIEEDLTKHHVIPRTYLKHFPNKKELQAIYTYDLLIMCVPCHEAYEIHANDLKLAIQKEMTARRGSTGLENIQPIKNHARALLFYRNQIPKERIAVLEKTVRKYLGKEEITDADLQEVHDTKPLGGLFDTYEQAVVAQLDNFDDFMTRWRRHFVEVMTPPYLPRGWNTEIRLCESILGRGNTTSN